MRRNLPMFLLPLLAVLAILVLSAVYVVDVRQKALVMRFGQVVEVRDSPGLGFKVPFIDQVIKYDARILGLSTQPMEITPLDDRRLVVDAFARWQITDVARFRRAVPIGGIETAQNRLAGILSNAIREVLGGVPSTTVLSDDRTALMNAIRDRARAEAEALGVQVIDVRLTRTDLPEQNLNATYARMRAEREREAADEIARGGEAAQRVRATADRTVVELTSVARRRAEVIRGEADAQRNAIFAAAFGRDPEFFAFTRSMAAYERSMQGNNSSIVMAPDGDFFTYLRDPGQPGPGIEAAAAEVRAREAAAREAGEAEAPGATGEYDPSAAEAVLDQVLEAPLPPVLLDPASAADLPESPAIEQTLPADAAASGNLPASELPETAPDSAAQTVDPVVDPAAPEAPLDPALPVIPGGAPASN